MEAFLEEIENAMAEMGLVQIFLQTENTAPAYHFYLKHGFSELKNMFRLEKTIVLGARAPL